MKKLFSSAFSLLTSVALLVGAIPLSSFAEDDAPKFIDIAEDETISISDLDELALSDGGTVQIGANYDYDNGAYNLGYYLDANNAEVYKKMMELVNPSLDTVIVTLPEPLVIESSSWYFDINEEAAITEVFKACRSGITCASYDIPELFWIDINACMIGVRSVQQSRANRRNYTYTIYQLTIQPEYYSGFSSFDEVFEYKTKLEEAVENFEVTGNTRYEQIKSIHDQIAKFTYYDLEGQFSGSCLGGLVVPGVVCEGYSKAFKLICDRIGIPCICVFGNYDIENLSAHMWNYVQMEDGQWYGLDVTWDDYDGRYGYQIVYDFFLKGSNSFFEKHTEGTEYVYAYYTYPTISANDFDPRKPIVTTTKTTTATTTTTTTTTSTTTTTTATTTTSTSTSSTTSTTSTAKTTTSTTSTTVSSTTLPTTSTTKVNTTTTSSAIPTTTSSSTTTTATNLPIYPYGDVNHDGSLGIADLVCCSEYALGKPNSKCYEDLTDDEVIDFFDVIVLRRLLTITVVID